MSFKITSVQGHDHLHKERPFIALLDSFSSSQSDDKLFDQPDEPQKTIFPIAVIVITAPPVPKYTKEELQQILKPVLEAQASITSKESENRLLKAYFPDDYYKKSYIECFNFCQQCEDYFAAIRVKGINQIFFTAYFLCN